MTGRTHIIASLLFAAVWHLANATPARAQHVLGTSGPIARAVARVSIGFAEQQPAVDTAWLDTMALLPVGADIRVTLETSRSLRGTFVAADAESVTLWVHDTDRQLMRHDIRRVEMSKGTRQDRHRAIGAVLGAVLGGWAISKRCGGKSLSDTCWEEMMLYVGGPMMLGGVLGHKVPKGVVWREIYVRRP
jgi:hypothetical protein